MRYSDSAAQRLNQYEVQVLIDAMNLIDVLTSKDRYDEYDPEDYEVDLEGTQEALTKSVAEFREWAQI